MADFEKKVSLIEIEVDNEAAKAKVDELSSSILAQKNAVKSNSDEIRKLNKTNTDLEKQVKAGTISQKQANEQIAENSKRAFELEKTNLSLKDGIKDLNGERRNAVKATKLQSNSLDALRKKVGDQKKELNSLNTETKEGRKRFDELTQSLKDNNDKIKELDQGAGDFKTTVGDYRGEVGKAIKDTGLFGGTIGRLTEAKETAKKTLNAYTLAVTGSSSGMGKASKAAKVFKIALASTGIGLLVVALGSLITFLTTTQKGMDAVAKVTKPLEVIFGRLLGVVQELGGKVFDQLNNAIENPIETIKELGRVIIDNILNRFKSVLVLGDAIEQLFKGNFKEAAKLGADAFIQMGTGITNATDKIAEATGNIKEFVGESVKLGTDLADLDKQIEQTEISLIKNRARLNNEFEKQKSIAEDVTKSEKERIAAAQAAQKAQENLLAEERKFIDLKIKRKELENSINDTSREDEKALAELIAQRTEFEAAATGKRVSVRNLENSILQGIANEEKARAAEYQKQQEAKAKEAEAAAQKAEEARRVELEKEKAIQAEREQNQMILNTKLLALEDFRRSQQNERQLKEAEDYKTFFELKEAIAGENFLIERERLLEQRMLIAEDETLNAEEKAIRQAEYDLMLEELKAEHAATMVDIEEQQKNEELAIIKEKESKRLAILSATNDVAQSGVQIANNVIEGFYRKRFDNLQKQLESGQITEEEYAHKKEQLEKHKANALYKSQLAEFRIQKAIDLITVGTKTAASIAAAVAASPLTGGLPFAAINAGIGAAQAAAIISKQAPPPPTFADGGDVFGIIAGGKPHSQGGTKYKGEDGNSFEVEKDEGIFVTKRSATNPALQMLSDANTASGGRSMFSGSSRFLQDGGEASKGTDSIMMSKMLEKALGNMPAPVVQVQSIIGGVNAENEAKQIGVI